MKIPFVEKVPEVAGQIKPAAEQFIQRGYNVIIGTAFGYSDSFKELSEKYPKVAFLNASGTTNGPNLESFYGRTYESQYLCGMIAGGMSKTGKLGFVAAHPIGPVNWTINAYELGAQKINPNRDRHGDLHRCLERSRQGTRRRFGPGGSGHRCDRPARRHADTSDRRAGARHLRYPDITAICASLRQRRRCVLRSGHGTSSCLRNSRRSQRVTAAEPLWRIPGIKEGGTDIACCGSAVPKELADKVMAERDAIIAGKQIFTGPMKDTTGKEVLAAGKPIDDGGLWKMDWYLPGVIAQK